MALEVIEILVSKTSEIVSVKSISWNRIEGHSNSVLKIRIMKWYICKIPIIRGVLANFITSPHRRIEKERKASKNGQKIPISLEL